MAAKVYSTPDGLDAPEFDEFFGKGEGGHGFDSDAYFKACEDHEAKVAEWCRANSKSARLRGNVVGKTISFGVADGKAQYMVFEHTPLSLIHLPYVDAYQADTILLRGLNLTDVKRMVRADESLASLFGKSNRRAS